jgi:uncharacterized membrane protein YidH (DUF202 family)
LINCAKQAYERIRVAYDRTVMAAVRAATSLITFRFIVYKFFELEVKERITPAGSPDRVTSGLR